MFRITSIIPYMGILLILLAMGPADAFIGYDCDSKNRNITTISLIDTNDCGLNADNVKSSIEDIALLKLNTYEHTEVIQCKVEISRQVYFCGMFSHNSIIDNANYTHAITHEECKKAHESGTMTIGNTIINNLKVNTTTSGFIVLAGSIESDGTCTSGSYSDPKGTWENVVVTGSIKITLQSNSAKTKVENDLIILPSGDRCKLSEEQCMDSDKGYAFWDAIPRTCSDEMYSKLFEGKAVKLESEDGIVYLVRVNGGISRFRIIGSESSCGVKLYKTESFGLFFVKSKDLKHLGKFSLVNTHANNVDSLLNLNVENETVERHIDLQFKSLSLDMIKHYCELKQKKLKNALTLASKNPDEFAFQYMGGEGYKAYLAGDVINIVQCIPVMVQVRQANKCYNYLPIKKGNDNVFLMPRTHFISKNANEIPCNSPLLGHYKVDGDWYKFMPNPVKVPAPKIMF